MNVTYFTSELTCREVCEVEVRERDGVQLTEERERERERERLLLGMESQILC